MPFWWWHKKLKVPCDGVDGGHWRALPMVGVGGALGHPHDVRDDDPCPWHSSL